MKKVKVMLMAIMVLAIAGGALAFKTKFSDEFCTVQPTIVNAQTTCIDEVGATLFCSETVFDATTTTEENEPLAILKCTAELNPVLECDIPCPALVYTITEGDGGN